MTRTKPHIALFDMDGTLYDSMPRHARAWMGMCRKYGLEATEDDFFLWEGRTGAASIGSLMQRTYGRDATEQECRELYAVKSELFKALPQAPVMPGVKQLIEWLQLAGYEFVLVTGSGQASLLDCIDRDFPGIFPRERRITSCDVTHGKPSPEPYLRGMALVDATPEECIVVENAPLGVESGHAAGAFTVGVVTGPIPRVRMEAAGADVVYDSMTECAQLLPKLLTTL